MKERFCEDIAHVGSLILCIVCVLFCGTVFLKLALPFRRGMEAFLML